MARSCEHGNEPLGSIKGEEFLTSILTISFSRTLLHGVTYTRGFRALPEHYMPRPSISFVICTLLVY
jgi:hypothetical protein